MERMEIKLEECCLTCEHFKLDMSGLGMFAPCDVADRRLACEHMAVCGKYSGEKAGGKCLIKALETSGGNKLWVVPKQEPDSICINGDEFNIENVAKQFAERMTRLNEMEDTESRHSAMDKLMCETLEMLGLHEGVEIFRNTDAWYA